MRLSPGGRSRTGVIVGTLFTRDTTLRRPVDGPVTVTLGLSLPSAVLAFIPTLMTV